jgi:predicted Rossmann fold flavoprotein
MRIVPFLIIGAGPAGLAAATAYGSGAVILERNAEAGQKLLLSGSGQCNFTNDLSNEEFIRACRKAGPFLKRALYKFDSSFFIELLEQAGCPSFTREDGKVFPLSLKAQQVRDALLKTALDKGATLQYNSRVSGISRTKNSFVIETQADQYKCQKLLIACGGSSWPQTGSTGDGYAFAESLGHFINPVRPALAYLETKQAGTFRSCMGNTIQELEAKFYTGKGVFSDRGDLLFTHLGLSGPLILNNSYLCAPNDIIRLKLVPEAVQRLSVIVRNNPDKTLLNALKALPLSEAVLTAILLYLKIDARTVVRDVSKKQINKLTGYLMSADFTVKKVESLHTCMSTAGGVALKEVNSATLESRVVPGLYLAGEVLDYALPTGGFNIQAAFSTGSLAGTSARL